MDTFLDAAFGGLFDSVDPLGMVLRTLLALLADSLSKVVTSLYSAIFDITTVDLASGSVQNIWRITTGLSAALATILLVVAAFRSMIAQSNQYLLTALPGVVLAILGPQAATAVLPLVAGATTDLAKAIVGTATPDLAASMRLLAGVGNNAFYEGLGLLAPVIAGVLLCGLFLVFFVLMFCMAAAVVLYVLSPFAFAGLVMAPTRPWFTRWATAMFSVLFAKVPIAILLVLAVSLFANSAQAGMAQSFVNATAGLILGLGALLSPLLAFGLFSFMGTVASRPPVPTLKPIQSLRGAYYSAQMGSTGINAMRSVAGHGVSSSADSGSTGPAKVNSSSRGRSAAPAPTAPSATPSSSGATASGASGSGKAAAGAAAGAATAGVGAGVVAGAQVAAKAGRSTKRATTGAATAMADPNPTVQDRTTT
jgi:hypothetical protein